MLAGGFFILFHFLTHGTEFMLNTTPELIQESSAQNHSNAASLSSERRSLDHLRALEAESIYILPEAVAEFARPVMLYSIGKDSSVMLRRAQKPSFPVKIR